MMGRVAVRDLYETAKDSEIVLVGSTLERAKEFAKQYGNRVTPAGVDAADIDATTILLKNADVVLNCVQYYHNLHVMRAALKAGCHYLDLGGLFHMTRKQLKLNKKFEREELTAILGMGSTPGITNVLAAYGAKMMDEVKEIHIKVGSADFSNYAGAPPPLPYSLATLVDEFTMKPAVLMRGKLKFVEPTTGRISVPFPKPIGNQSALFTLHSELATFPKSFAKKGVRDVTFRVGFEEAFVDKILFLNQLGLTRDRPIDYKGQKIIPREFIAKVATAQPSFQIIKREDYECLRVELIGRKGSKPKAQSSRLTIDCIAQTHPTWKIAAGDVDTGTPPSIVAQMMVHEDIRDRGAFAPEYHVPPEVFFKELEKRYMQIVTRWI